MTQEQPPVLDVRNISVEFRRRRREPLFRALNDVSLTVPRGTTMGLVGESGSGKSTLAKAVLGLVPTQSGSVHLLGQDTTHLKPAARRKLGSSLQAVFQDPNSSLNPSYTVGRSLAEPMRAQGIHSRDLIARRTEKMLEDVGLDPAAATKYPRDFSGGQRQRISIARALMTEPELVICDESVSALDLSVKAQILNLLADLQEEHGVGYLFITHDMSVVRHICHDVTVLYRGQVMEAGPTRLVTREPAHPYTRALLLAAPVADPTAQRQRRAIAEAGDLASAETPSPKGCPFAGRCPFAQQRCRETRPEARTLADGRIVACHRYPEWQREIPADASPRP
ncbi:oligopeptide/dipeptide ABC transporter ATP-binding protein [Streptomyces ipomoeae]|uniref:oligopeptide/dipeptide ABC transporter ATP-binding protein n=1 Tax=Streptomyces ipomoeae TaxID=103232 RepID=UPI0011466ACF|nr:ABC transporter ATP-binding protein [Streptomyces ipomoeae]MDX2937900.1 ABC transporter ATP-binding protein [Streptomyces ipomoeae]TQE18283.1 ABC transporter ATP-binding protein [Streptomyces ipomoeae]